MKLVGAGKVVSHGRKIWRKEFKNLSKVTQGKARRPVRVEGGIVIDEVRKVELVYKGCVGHGKVSV